MSNGVHTVNKLCPICAKISFAGHVNMAGQEMKYICPECGGRHYGEPEKDDAGVFKSYVCGKCNHASAVDRWETILMDAGEPVLGPIESCGECNKKLEDGKTCAFIVCEDGNPTEAGRTGQVIFGEPHEEFMKSLEKANHPPMVYIEQAVVNKMLPQVKKVEEIQNEPGSISPD